MNFLCQYCCKKYQSLEARDQHENSPAHNLKCTICDRIFKIERDRQQHVDDLHKAPSKPPSKPLSKPPSKPPSKPLSQAPSKALSKAPSYKCVKCNRSFRSEQARQQHLASPAHDRQTLQQNLVPLVYAPTLVSNAYSQSFDGQQTLQYMGQPRPPILSYNHTNYNYQFEGLHSLQRQTTDPQTPTIPSPSRILPDTAVNVERVLERPTRSEEIRVEPRRGLTSENCTMDTVREQDDRPVNQSFQYN